MENTSVPKSKRVVLSVEEKLSFIRKFEKGISTSSLAHEYGVSLQTVRNILKQKNQLQTFVQDCDSLAGPSKRKKTMKMSSYKHLDTAVLTWFKEKRSEGVPISGTI